MYIDPNTGGLVFETLTLFFQALTALILCSPVLAVVGIVIVYFVRKGKTNLNITSTNETSSH